MVCARVFAAALLQLGRVDGCSPAGHSCLLNIWLTKWLQSNWRCRFAVVLRQWGSLKSVAGEVYRIVLPFVTINSTMRKFIKWIVEAGLAAIGVLGAHDLADSPEAWVDMLAEHPWIAVVLTFGGGVGVTLALQDIWRSRLPHLVVQWLADRFWAIRQYFLGSMQYGHVRAYHPLRPDGEEPPDPVCLTSRAGVKFKRPWRSTIPDGEVEFWVATTFVTSGVDGAYSVLPPSKIKAWGPIYSNRNDWHTDRRSSDRYMRYRLPGGHFSPQIRLDPAPVQEWKELCRFGVPGGSTECYVPIRLEAIDLIAVSEFLVTFTNTETGGYRPHPSAVFGQVDNLKSVPAAEKEPDKDRMLYCQLAESGSSAAIGMPRYALPPEPSGIKCGLTFRQTADSDKDSVVDTLLFYHPGGNHCPTGLLSVDWR